MNKYGQPSRTFYVAITHDEEVGKSGARGVSEYLSKQPFGQNGEFEFVLDEGTVILEEALPTITTPIAIIGVAEKGYLSVQYRVSLSPGHSSMPVKPTAIGLIAQAIDKIDSISQPSQFGNGPEMSLLTSITPHLKFPLRVVLSNLWLFGPVVQWALSQKPGTDALQRTTTAVTLVSGGEKDNILPTSASATVNRRKIMTFVVVVVFNFLLLDRIHTADSCERILANNRRIINDDRLTVHINGCDEPSAISPYGKQVYAYRMIEQTIRQTFEQVHQSIIVAPGLMLGGTDSRSYTNLSKNIYRFSPFLYRHDDLNRLHGDNERIRHDDIQRGLNFYFHLIVNNQLENLPQEKINSEL